MAILSCFRALLRAVSSRARVASLTSGDDLLGYQPWVMSPVPLAPKQSPAPFLRGATGLQAGAV